MVLATRAIIPPSARWCPKHGFRVVWYFFPLARDVSLLTQCVIPMRSGSRRSRILLSLSRTPSLDPREHWNLSSKGMECIIQTDGMLPRTLLGCTRTPRIAVPNVETDPLQQNAPAFADGRPLVKWLSYPKLVRSSSTLLWCGWTSFAPATDIWPSLDKWSIIHLNEPRAKVSI